MQIDKIFVVGNGRISKYFFELGMRPFILSDFEAQGADAVVYADCADILDSRMSDFKNVADMSLICSDKQIPMIFISNDLVFGDGQKFIERNVKNPATTRGLEMLACEMVVFVDGNKTVRVEVGHLPIGFSNYLEKFDSVPQTLHLGTGNRLSTNKARRLGIYG